MVENCFKNGTYQLADFDGTLHASRVNGLHLKLYHAQLMIVEKDEENKEGESAFEECYNTRCGKPHGVVCCY